MRRIIAVLLAVAALSVALATPVLGDEPAESYRVSAKQVGITADAFWQTCREDTPVEGQTTCENVSLFAFDGRSVFRESGSPPARMDGFACVNLDVTDEFGFPVSGESGCTETFTFTAAPDLSTATLTATIPVEAFVCTETPEGIFCEPTGTGELRDVALSATWTGIGPITTFRDRTVSRTETDGFRCVFKQMGRGVRTEAVATATVDGTVLGDSQFGSLTDGTFKFVERCG